MDLAFQPALASEYKNAAQKMRIWSEHWVSRQLYCPSCGHPNITRYGNNNPVADFYCSNCREEYELKGHSRSLGTKIVDGAYRTMMERLLASNNPNLFLLGYNQHSLEVRNLLVIPKQFFVPSIIEKRKPLAFSARRAGWVGCNIRLDTIPTSGRIFLVRNGMIQPPSEVIATWRQTMFLRDQNDATAKGWLLTVMRCIDRINRNTFSLDMVYEFEDELKTTYPDNRNIRPKIRQQLQLLRDTGYLMFLGHGTYQLANNNGHKVSAQ